MSTTAKAAVVAVDTLAAKGKFLKFTFDDAARRETADLLQIISLERLAIEGRLVPTKKGATFDGVVLAALTQSCASTGESVAESYDLPCTGIFEDSARDRLAPRPGKDDEGHEIPADGPEVLGVIESQQISFLTVAGEHLALHLNPYPRKENAAAAPSLPDGVDLNGPERENPFAALKGLKLND